MRLASPALERAIRQRVRQEVRASAALWQAYLPVRRRQRFYAIGRLLLALIYAFSAIVMPMMLTVVFIGMAVFVKEAVRGREGNGTEVTLLLETVFLTGLTLAWTASAWAEIWWSREVAVLAHLPVSDAHRLGRLREQTAAAAAICGYIALWAYGYVAWSHQFSLARWSAALLLAVLQGVLSWAVMMLLLGRLTAMVYGILGVSLFVTSMSVGFGGFWIRPWVEGFAWLGYALLPAGWINGTFDFALVRGEAAGWLWLAPLVGVVLLLAVRRSSRLVAIKDFVFLPNRKVVAIPEDESLPIEGWVAKVRTTAPQVPGESLPASPAAGERHVRTSNFLTGIDWQTQGWVERLFCHWLNERERVIAEVLLGDSSRGTRWWKRIALGTSPYAVLLAIPASQDALALLAIPGVVLLALVLVIGPGSCSLAELAQLRAPPCAWLPIGYRELARVLLKANILGCLLLLPFAVGFALMAAWRTGFPPLRALELSLQAAYLGVTLCPWLVVLVFSMATNDTSQLLRRLPGLVLVLIVASVYVFSAMLFFVPTLWFVLQGLVLLTACSAGMLCFYLWILHRTSVDWVRR